MRIGLEFSPEQNAVHRRRISYAFRVFCAVYGYEPVVENARNAAAEVWITYDGEAHASRRPFVQLSNLYQPRPPIERAPAPHNSIWNGGAVTLIYPHSPAQSPDWLAEIFEWLSCADEYAVQERDAWQRVPFPASYVGRHHLDPMVPYAAIAMQHLNSAISRFLGQGNGAAPSPSPSADHFVVVTHDVDYFPMGRVQGVRRLAKNAAISLLAVRRPMLALKQLMMALRLACGSRDPMDQIEHLLQTEMSHGISASYYFLSRRLHPRDANYSFESTGVVPTLRLLAAAGMEVGVHGTYTCLDTAAALAEEYQLFRGAGFDPEGGRQHWLRFTLDRLIRGLESAGASYDTSLGWADRIGYRAGACFAFPPYNFDEERAARFVEIPMAIMDVALRDQGCPEDDWYAESLAILSTSRQFGWGAVSLLWHPAAFGGAWLSARAGEAFWRLLETRAERNETWLSAAAFVRTVRQRYVDAGLWPDGENRSEPASLDHSEADAGAMDALRVLRN